MDAKLLVMPLFLELIGEFVLPSRWQNPIIQILSFLPKAEIRCSQTENWKRQRNFWKPPLGRKQDMLSFDITEAANCLPELVEKCINGEEIVIVRNEKVAAKLVSFTGQHRHRSGYKMVYKDYLKAACKHQITCEAIADKLELLT